MVRFVLLGCLGLMALGPRALAQQTAPAPEPVLQRLPAVETIATGEEVAGDKAGGKKAAPADAEKPKTTEKKEAAKESEKKTAEEPAVDDVLVPQEVDWWLWRFAPIVPEYWDRYCNSWSGSVEMGLDGSSGNTDTFNIRLGVDAKRKTDTHEFTLDLDYHKNTNESLETANRLDFEGRYERPSKKDNRWSWFVQGTATYDEFQPWDVQLTAGTGVGYYIIKDDASKLQARFGGGSSREIGGPDKNFVPELHFGLDGERQLTQRQKVKASVQYYPDVTEFGEFRLVSKADWEVLLDKEKQLSLKLSASDRFQRPNPGGRLNDIDYSLVLLWKF